MLGKTNKRQPFVPSNLSHPREFSMKVKYPRDMHSNSLIFLLGETTEDFLSPLSDQTAAAGFTNVSMFPHASASHVPKGRKIGVTFMGSKFPT